MNEKIRIEKSRSLAFGLWPLVFLVSFVCFVGNACSQDLDSIRSAIASGNVELVRNALGQIKNLHTEAASRLAIPALADKDLIVRATAASSIIFLPKPEASSLLTPLLNDKFEFVRTEAAFALGEVGDASATTALLKALEKDTRVVKAATATALGKIGDVSAIGPLTSVLRSRPQEDNEFLRRCAAHAIGKIAEINRHLDWSTTTPENFLAEKYKTGYLTAAKTPQLQNSQKAVETLIGVLSNKGDSDDARREAAFALGAIGDPVAKSVLTQHLNSADNYLAEICKEALLKLEKTR